MTEVEVGGVKFKGGKAFAIIMLGINGRCIVWWI